MKQLTLQLETLTCPSCLASIEGLLKNIKGVEAPKVLFNASKAKMQFDPAIVEPEEVQQAIEKHGYEVLKVSVK
ncbi:heavy-metal-associated domain-containing protein [Macrococcus psychrotolerans]|uniref:Copper chaperone CopZ n=1 Tax=Macrococcus psychrotolerans TaxID=3039389 RepID=A0AAU6RAB0_9STAP